MAVEHSSIHLEKSTNDNVIDIFTKRPISENYKKTIRIAPELDHLEMLYRNDSNPDKIYSLKIACWALREDGEIIAMVPWLNNIVSCPEINDPLNGQWEGYRDPNYDNIFFHPPAHKVTELETAAAYYQSQQHPDGNKIVQEIPDVIGTHAVFTNDGFLTFSLVEVLSWRLMANGEVMGMLIDSSLVQSTPVLPGDECLFPAQIHPDFRYFFQHRIANKIKQHDPEALAALSMLIDPSP